MREDGARRRGPRAGESGTRSSIEAAARSLFASRGFAGTTVRMIALRAEVDPALVLHYFGSKSGLLAAVVDWTFDIDRARSEILGRSIDGIGLRLARVFLRVWDDAGDAHPILLLLRVAGTEPAAADHLTRLLRERLLDPLWPAMASAYGPELLPPDPAMRGALLASTLTGLALTRYVLRLDPLSSAPAEDVARHIAPILELQLVRR